MRPLARWNPAQDAWETDQLRICGHSDVFSETFPTSGMTRSGTAYGLPTSEHPTDDSASSLLPTPDVPTGGERIPADAIWDGATIRRRDGTKVQLHLSAAVERL